MTYQRHWLLSWGGTLGNGSDVWANNVRMMNPETGSSDDLSGDAMERLLDDFVVDIRNLFADARSFIPSAVECQWVKFNEIGPDGRYVDSTTTHVRFLEGSQRFKGVSSASVPTFQSVAVTTTTDRQRGPASKGRLFIPQCIAPVLATGRLDPSAQANAAAAYAKFLTDLGNESGVDTRAIAPFVVSNVGNPGPAERITGVRVGDVPDVIRRRKSAMTEKYVSSPVSTG